MKTKLFIFLLIFISVLIFGGCSKKRASRAAPENPKTFFGTTVPDSAVEITKALKPLKAAPAVDGKEIDVASRDWLELSGQLIETGELLGGADGDRLLKTGSDLNKSFYELPYSHTKMTATSQPLGNPYLDVAAPLAKPVLIQKWGEAIDGVKQKVTAAASQTKVALGDLPQDPLPEVLIQRVVDGLNKFRTLLIKSKDGNGDAIIDQITDSLQNDYVKQLVNLRDAARIDPKVPLSASLQKLGRSLRQLNEVSDLEKQRLMVAVDWGTSLALKTEAITQSREALAHLVDLWLNKYYRDLFPANLKEIFKGLSDAQISALATENKTPIYASPAEWTRVKARTDYILMPDIEVLAQFVQNNGQLLSPVNWMALRATKGRALDGAIQTRKINDLIHLLSVNETVGGTAEKKAVITNNWLGMSNRLSFPDDLKKAFSMFSDEDLELLKSDQKTFNSTLWLAVSGHEKLAVAHYKILAGIESFGAKPGQTLSAAQGIAHFKEYFEDKIIAGTRARVNNAVMPIAGELSKELSDTLMPLLEKQKASGEKIATESFNIYSRYYMGKLIFGAQGLTKQPLDGDHVTQDNVILNQNPLPILEEAALRFATKNGSYENLPPEPKEDVTSAETLGLALTNSFYRLRNLETTEGLKPESTEAIQLNFEPIAKMLALSGYHGADARISESLTVPVTPGHDGALLEIHQYEPEKIAFASPDKIYVKNEFKLDHKTENNAQISVRGQMELLRGYAHMMHFFKPWEPSQFDTGLGALRIDEAPTVKTFDKEDFFLLSIGLASVVLKNIPLKMMGLITDKGAFIESAAAPDPSKLSVTGAVLADYDADKMSHVIATRDMALAIEAVAEFYDEAQDLEKTANPVLLDVFKATPAASIRGQLKKLLSGLVLFSTGRLMAQDGGFAPSYDGDSATPSKKLRSLEDQLLMERALLTAGRVLKSNFILARAADNFFFLNGHFWVPELGFYKESEDATQATAKLSHVALALGNAVKLIDILPGQMTQGSNLEDSQTQLQKLRALWISRFFNGEILKGSPINLVSEYSL